MENNSYQEMLPIERQLLVGKIVDLLIYDATFFKQMVKVVEFKEELGMIKSKFMPENNELFTNP